MYKEYPSELQALPYIEFVSEALPYDGLKSKADDQETPDQIVSVTNLSAAPDGGLTAWLVVVA
jgi:MCP family monocarboxylic acid transporter-like MFS transporter 10